MTKTMRALLALTFIAALVLALASPAGAHHSILSPTTARPCGQTAPWSATVTVHSDDPQRGKHWQIQHSVSGGLSYSVSPGGRVIESTQFVISIPSIAANVASVTVNVRASWYNYSSSSSPSVVDSWRQVTVQRPAARSCPTTTTTTSTTTSTTTTTTRPTTTTAPTTTVPVTSTVPTTAPPTTVPQDPGAPARPVPASPSFTG